MAINHKELSKALKILSENPTKIEEAKKRYNEKLSEIQSKELSGHWSPVAIKEMKERARSERNSVCNALTHSMRAALNIVKDNNNYESDGINLSDAKLQTALSMVSLMGKNMSYVDQVGVLNQFRGQPAALRVLQSAFERNGQAWAAGNAKELQKPISQQAIDEMNTVLAFAEYAESKGEFSFPIEKAYWTKGEFGRQADRLGYDLSAEADPYDFALDLTLNNLEERKRQTLSEADPSQAKRAQAHIDAMRYRVEIAKRELANAKANGTDKATVFEKAMKSLEVSTASPEA